MKWVRVGLCVVVFGCTPEPVEPAPQQPPAIDVPPAVDSVPAPDEVIEVDAGAPVDVPDVAGESDAGPRAPETPDWMRQLLTDRSSSPIALVDMAIPRSHDAGTYVLTTCTFGASACNTQTQHLSMLQQLEAGIRVFDVRPSRVGGEYFTHHTTECGGFGCEGDSMKSLLAQTRSFLDAHAELVILQLGHYCNTSSTDEALVELVASTLGERLYVDSAPQPVGLIQRDLRAVIPPEAGTGKVIVTWGGLASNEELRAQGRFASSALPTEGGWSNKQHLDDLIEDQLERYAKFESDGSALFELSWTLTMDTDLAIACWTEEDPRTIESMAAETNGALAATLDTLIEAGAIHKGRIPNILSVDHADVFATEQCIRLSYLNLQ